MVIIAIVIAMLFAMFMGLHINDYNKKRIGNMKVQMQNIQDSIQMTVDNMEIIATQLGVSPALYKIMSGLKYTSHHNELEEDIYLKQEMYKYLLSYIVKKDNISRIRVFNAFEDYVYVGDLELERESDFHKSKAYVESLAKAFEEDTVFTYNRNKPSLEQDSKATAISIVREIKEDLYRQSDTIAYLEVEVSNQNLKKRINHIIDSETRYIVYDNEQRLLLYTNIEGIPSDIEYSTQTLINHYQNEMYIVNDSLERENISVMILESRHLTKDYIVRMMKMLLLFYFSLLLILIFIQKRIADALTSPLVALCDTVSNQGNTTEMIQIPKLKMQAEFTLLSEAFNQMTSSLNETMERVIVAKTGEVKAQLFALQSQMNPHFIHNTLAIIQAYASDEDYETVDLTCDKLSSIIRYGADYSKSTIELSEELEHAKNYIDLVKLRYEDNVHFEVIGVDKDLKGIMVPRFVLQPIIENSLEHGLKKKRFPWKIEVRIVFAHKRWTVEVTDDGLGMTDIQVNSIEQYINEIKSGNIDVLNEHLKIGGLSIKNIIGRLYLEYQENMIFEVNSIVDSFTSITFGGRLND